MKKIIALLVALTMISTLLPMIASAEDIAYNEEVYREYDFDNTTNSSLPLAENIGGHSKVAKHPNVTLASSEVIMFSGVPAGAVTVLETDIGVFGDVSDTAAMTFFQYRVSPGTATSNRKACLGRNASGNFTFMGADSGIPMNIGEWYRVTLTVPQVSGSSTLTVVDSEGNEVGTYTRTSSAPNLARATFMYVGSTTSALNYTYYDNFKVSYLLPSYTIKSFTAKDREGVGTGTDKVDYIDPSLVITFSQKMKSAPIADDTENTLLSGDVKIYDAMGNEVPFTGTLDAATGKVYTIKFSDNLIAKQTYTIVSSGAYTANGVGYWNGEEIVDSFELEFTVGKKDFAIENVVRADSGDTISYDVTIRNKTGENQEGYIVVARYDGEKLVAVTTTPVVGSADGNVYENITLADLDADADAVILITSDGNFQTLDIWEE